MSYSSTNCHVCGFFTFDERRVLACPYQEKGCPLVAAQPRGPSPRLLRLAVGFVLSAVGVIAVTLLIWAARSGAY